ncbi:hypothetical protein SAMN05660464_0992 [Geodermatophilus dictyosporus]|uniref:CopC domain-containing protein n=1 Tax=Geodermatophilus dictyosporus TaxID=1523247 RepID=A0A1I5JS68_9ACTN|nr:copper resistance CopC family protein [Geodermatophilus dictyosporus]SFO75617.1 hypothetical protein SAMN05660464_0992 [Geodermatophilus dictyosporus]
MRVHRTPAPARDTALHRPAALLLVLGAALVLLGTGVAPAAAHDELVGSVPAAGATVPAPAQVELQLSAPAQALGTQVLVSGPDGAAVSEGPAALAGSTVVQPLRADLPAGGYTVEWRVTSSDGHPLEGAFSFTVTGPATAAPTAGRPPSTAPPAAPAPAAPAAADPATSDPAASDPAASDPAASDPAASGADGAGAGVSPAWLAGGGLLAAAAVLGTRSLRRRS